MKPKPPVQRLKPIMPNLLMMEHWFAALRVAPEPLRFNLPDAAAAWQLRIQLYRARSQYKMLWQRNTLDKHFAFESLRVHCPKGSLQLSILPDPIWDVVGVSSGVAQAPARRSFDIEAEIALCKSLIEASHIQGLDQRSAAAGMVQIVSRATVVEASDEDVTAALEVIEAQEKHIEETAPPSPDAQDLDL